MSTINFKMSENIFSKNVKVSLAMFGIMCYHVQAMEG